MEIKVGVREFRDNLASFLEGEKAVEVTRHGETIGYYIPRRRRPTPTDRARLLELGAQVDAQLAAHGVTEEELMADFKALRKRRR